jgi:hypothetical protein
MNPVGKTSTSWENRCQLKKASPGEVSPVGSDAPEATSVLAHQTQADETAPVLAHQRDVREVQPVEQQRAHPLDVAGVGVVAPFGWLVRSTEAHEVGSHDLQPGLREDGDHLAVQIRPRRLPVQEEHHRSLRITLTQVMHPQRTPLPILHLDIVRVEVESGK